MEFNPFKKEVRTDPFLTESYSQEGEDSILARIFGEKTTGFFVDIGAHHPKRFSNTYKFYKRGWRGINIDATPGSMKLFVELRPEDCNLEIPISDAEERLILYTFNEPALNTLSATLARARDRLDGYHITNQIQIQTVRLETILDSRVPPGQKIQFMSVDAEGFDHKILRSNNWKKYRPEIVLFEGDHSYTNFISSEICRFVMSQDYEFVAKTVSTYFFKDLR